MRLSRLWSQVYFLSHMTSNFVIRRRSHVIMQKIEPVYHQRQMIIFAIHHHLTTDEVDKNLFTTLSLHHQTRTLKKKNATHIF